MIFRIFNLLTMLFTLVLSHSEMVKPPPRHSQYNQGYKGQPDYDMNSPLGIFPCKGYEKGNSVGSYQAGSDIAVSLYGEGDGLHNGGHCQFSLSYDNAKTFVVIKTVLSECLRKYGFDYNVTLPSNAPSSKSVVFAWNWINRTGNREFYMNCADIEITDGPYNGTLSGPEILVVNLPNTTTIPEFTDKGSYEGIDLFSKVKNVTINFAGDKKSAASRNSFSIIYLLIFTFIIAAL